MASWSYQDWVTYTGATALERLNLHIAEVSERIDAERAAGDHRINPYTLIRYYEQLVKERDKLTATTGIDALPGGTGRTRVRFTGI